jgi:uncharacterized repeat protein (TIGR03803 family)
MRSSDLKLLYRRQSRLVGILAAFVLSVCSLGWATYSESVIYTFTDENGDASTPYGGLVLDHAGDLYGMTSQGGAFGAGAVYELTPNNSGGWTESVIYSFTGGSDGSSPVSGLAIDQTGNLYGTTHFGGNSGCSCGTVFELKSTSGGWQYNLLYTFTGGDDGSFPWASLTLDASGNVYGVAFEGGSRALGTAFSLRPTAGGRWSFELLHTFSGGKDGSSPTTNLTFDAEGNLYGTTEQGGGSSNCKMGCGTAYELTPTAGRWRETVLHSFTGAAGGQYPNGGLIFDSAGNLYGVAGGGGLHGQGTVYELSPSSGRWESRVLHNFIGKPDGAAPQGSLIFDSAGNLYGTTDGGGAGFGTAFELSPSAGKWNFLLLHTFYVSHSDAAEPTGGLIMDSSGNLYGAASGGNFSAGVVFELSPTSGR